MILLLAGSPLEARQNVPVLQYFLAILLFVFIVVIINKGYKRIKSAFLKDIKNTASKTDKTVSLKKVVTKYKMDSLESAFLNDVVKRYSINLNVLYSGSEASINAIWKNLLTTINTNSEKFDDSIIESRKSFLFSIKDKIDKNRIENGKIFSTRNFPEKISLQIISKDSIQYNCTLLKNTDEGLILTLPHDIYNNTVAPKTLSKIFLFTQLRDGLAYQFFTRVIRFQSFESSKEMVLSHTNNLTFFQRRHHKRTDTDMPCFFSAVKVTSGGSGPSAKISYTPLEQQYKGKIEDISGGGCSLICAIPIKEQQYISLKMQILPNITDNVIGIIVHTNKTADGRLHVLHIRYVKMSKKTRNNILSLVYNYVD